MTGYYPCPIVLFMETTRTTQSDTDWLINHHGMMCANGYQPKTSAAAERIARLHSMGLVHQTPKGSYGLTAKGAEILNA